MYVLDHYNTLKEIDSVNSRWVEFAIFRSAYAGMSGERVFKNVNQPNDVRSLPGDPKPVKKQRVITGKAAEHILDKISK